MILTTQMLMDRLHDYHDPAGKIMRMVKSGELIPLTRGLYETEKTIPGQYLAAAIYGPSYLSFDFALSRYGLIPETVYTYTSATFDKKKIKQYRNAFGCFTYRDVPKEAYPFCVELIQEGGYSYLLATPEKALCDKLSAMPPVHSIREIREMLFDDLRIGADTFHALDREVLNSLCDKYHMSNLKYLKRYLGGKGQ